jgi:hypothetical protein
VESWKNPVSQADIHRRVLDAALVVDYKIAFTVAHDVDQPVYFPLEVLKLITACIEVDHSYGFSGVGGNDEGIHASGWNCQKG